MRAFARPLLISITVLLACAAHAQLSYLYNFGENQNPPSDCYIPASDGNLYGGGIVFNPINQAAPANFPLPTCNFIQGTDNNFYYVDNGLENGEYLTLIDKVTLSGTSTTFASLTAAQGVFIAQIIQGLDGNFYGVAGGGGAYDYGTIFRVTPAGVVSVIYNFTDGGDGSIPRSLLQGSDGYLYGANSVGTFRASTTGDISILSSTPLNPLVQATATTFYGINVPASESSAANFYSLATDGTLTQVATSDSLGTLGGVGFAAPLYLGGDGNFYCSTGGTDDNGNPEGDIVQITPSGEVTAIATFEGAGEQYALAGNGIFYGLVSYVYSNYPTSSFQDYIYSYAPSPVTPAITLTLSSAQVIPGEKTTLTWKTTNAIADNMQLCYASGSWSGVQPSSGSVTASAPATPGTYRYALTCGGVETGSVLLYDAVPNVALTVTPNEFAANYGTEVSLSAAVTGINGTPTGTVQFFAVTGTGNEPIGTATLNSSGVATLNFSSNGIQAGVYQVIAVYSGSSKYASATSTQQQVEVFSTKQFTLVTLSASAATVSVGQSLTLTASIYGGQTGQLVSFYVGTTLLGTAPLSPSTGTATLTLKVPAVTPGIYTITATYPGNYLWAAGSGSASVQLDPYVAAATLTATPNPVTPPATLTLSVQLTAPTGAPVPTGSVSFYQGTTYLGSATLGSTGAATFPASTTGLAAGTYSYSADYAGSADYATNTSTTSVKVK